MIDAPAQAPHPGAQPAGVGWTLQGDPFARDWNDPVATAWCDAWKDHQQLPYVADADPERGPIISRTKAPKGGYWCARCQSGIVPSPGLICLACREGWTR